MDSTDNVANYYEKELNYLWNAAVVFPSKKGTNQKLGIEIRHRMQRKMPKIIKNSNCLSDEAGGRLQMLIVIFHELNRGNWGILGDEEAIEYLTMEYLSKSDFSSDDESESDDEDDDEFEDEQ